MRSGVCPALTILVLALAAAAAAASAKVTVNSCKHEKYKPSRIVIACGDGSEYLSNLKWSSWSKSAASGKGSLHLNNCTPSCVSGHFRTYKVKVKLSKPKGCPGQKHKVFDTVKLIYGKKHPGSATTQTLTLGCPI